MEWFGDISHYSIWLARNSYYETHIKKQKTNKPKKTKQTKKTGRTLIPQFSERPIYISLIYYKLAGVFKAFKITGIYVNSEAKDILTYIK